MKSSLDRAHALLGGTDAMREAGEKFLPKFPGESQLTYDWRLKVAVLNNFYEAMAGQMVGKMFEKAVSWEKPSSIDKSVLENIDKRGNDINGFACALAKALLTKGRPHILIDHPKKPDEAQTRADDLALGLRPYWVLMEPEAVVSAFAETENGGERLLHFRWREFAARLEGFAIESVERIRVMTRGPDGLSFEIWERRSENEQWVRKDAGGLQSKSPLIDIPIVTLYSDRQSFMVSKPTLDDVAHKNIEHWQSSADQRHILTITRFPLLYQFGTDEPVNLVGPYSMLHSQSPRTEAEMGYAESQGTGIEHGFKDLDRIVSEAEAMAVRIITSDAAKTESGEQADYAKEGSPLQKLSVEIERALNQALLFTARFQGLSDDKAGRVRTHKDFGLSSEDAKAIDAMIKMRAAGDLSQPTLWTELMERGFFRSEFNPKKEAGLIEEEKQTNLDRLAASMGGGPGAEDDDESEDDPPAEGAAAAA